MNGYLVLAGIVSCSLGAYLISHVVVPREAHRQEVVREWNCAHYGEAINKLAGSEVCPPTPHG